jgi:hypothetical protein
MNTPNPFAELAVLAGSARKAARMLAIPNTRFHRLRHSVSRVKFTELEQVRIALETIRAAKGGTQSEVVQ